MSEQLRQEKIEVTSLPETDYILGKIDELKRSLQEQSPQYETILHTIHQKLSKDEAVVTLLSEEQIGIIVAGLTKKKGIVLATTKDKSTAANGKKLSKLTADDL